MSDFSEMTEAIEQARTAPDWREPEEAPAKITSLASRYGKGGKTHG